MCKLMLPLSAIFALSCCVPTDKPKSAPPLCGAFFIIHPSRLDTVETKRQVLTHNTVYRGACQGESNGTHP